MSKFVESEHNDVENLMGQRLEIQVHEQWIRVSPFIFRSWGGPRRLNGKPFAGPVYVLGTDNVSHITEASENVK